MQRQLYHSIKHLCRPKCHRCLYSTQVAAHRVASDISSSPRPLKNAEDLGHGETSAGSSKKPSTPAVLNQLQPLSPDAENPRLAPTKVEAYLASLRAGGIEPTLEDLSRLAPKKIPSAKSPGYAKAYLDLVDRLCRTFSKSQLRRFCQDLELDRRYSRSGRKKVEYAEAIMEKEWGWENVNEVEKRIKDASEVVVKSFPVSASELFLLLGKDGSELLQISRDYNVHISVKPNPLSIRIEGFKAPLRKLEVMMAERRKSITEERVELPTREPLSTSLLQQVSRTANAFIENVGSDGAIRIRAMSRQRLNLAKRLAFRAAVQIRHSLHMPFTALLPPPPSAFAVEESPSSYALFPFTPQRSLPWTNESGSTFRSRKVSDWLGDGSKNFALFSADLSGRKGRFINEKSEVLTLEDAINNCFPSENITINASTGHILIMGTSQQDQSSILPPFPGRWHYSELLDWMKDGAGHRIFVPCLPFPLQSAPPTQEKIVHRLTYHRLEQSTTQSQDREDSSFSPVQFIRAEMVINRQKLEEPEPLTDDPASAEQQEETLMGSELDTLLIDEYSELDHAPEGTLENSPQVNDSVSSVQGVVDGTASAEPADSPIDDTNHETPSETEVVSSDVSENADNVERNSTRSASDEPSCHRGKELEILVALPDRPMDLKLTVLGSVESVSTDTIPELDRYFGSLKAYLDNTVTETSPPEPPLFIEDGGDRYILDLNASVRQSLEAVAVDHGAPLDLDSPRLDDLSERRILTTTESIYDLESGQKLTNCEVAFKGSPSGGSWTSYLTDIDYITSFNYKTKQAPAANNLFALDEQASNGSDTFF